MTTIMVQIIFVGAFIIAIMTAGIAPNQGPKYGMISKTPSIIPRTSAYGSFIARNPMVVKIPITSAVINWLLIKRLYR